MSLESSTPWDDGDVATSRKNSVYFDEEDLLGYKIWVAELELLVSQQKQQVGGGSGGFFPKVDFGACYILLQKLHATIDKTSVEEIKMYQRRCEDALIDILLKGAPPPIRRLISSSLSKVYGKGDQLPLFSRVSSLQLFLGTREAFGSQTSEDVRLGAMELMSSLYYSHGKSLAVGVYETSSIATKYCARSCSNTTRQAALRLLAATVEGIGYQHREASNVYTGALKCIERIMKEKDVNGDPVKLGTSDVLRAIAVAAPIESWTQGVLSFDTVRALCLAGVRDHSSAVRSSFARALGELVASVHCKSGDVGSPKDDGKSKVADNIEVCLTAPLAEALIAEDRETAVALSQAWVYFLKRAKAGGSHDDAKMLELSKGPFVSVRVASATSSSVFAEKSPFGPDVGLGTSISTGERPFSEACVTYILRCGIIEQMGEFGQREFVERLTTALLHGFEEFTTSLIITQLEILSHLMYILGEIGEEGAGPVEQVIAKCLVHESAAVRYRAGAALAALALSEPGRAARLFGSSLNALKNAADALVDASNSVSEKGRSYQGAPRWPGANKFAKEIDSLNGWAVAVACLVAATPSLPLGIPSHYLRVTCQIAAALIESPRCEHPGGRSVELESGFIILGSLSRHSRDVLQDVYEDVLLNMWLSVFSESSTENLTKVLAMKDEQAASAELWWRSEAFHALASYVEVGSQYFMSSERELLRTFAVSIIPIISENGILSQPTLNPPRGGFSQLQACAAIFQTRFFRLVNLMPAESWMDEAFFSLADICIDGILNSGTSVLSVVGLRNHLMSVLDLEEQIVRQVFFSNDIFERDLIQFCGASGGLERESWSLRVFNSSLGGSQTYPQSLSLPEALLLVRSHMLSRFLRYSSPERANLIALKLTEMPQSVKKDKTGTKKLALAILGASPVILACSHGEKVSHLSTETTTRLQQLAEDISLSSSQGLWVHMTASNLYYSLTKMLDAQHSHQTLSQLCQKAVGTASLEQRATYVLSIGSVCRGIGGLGLTSLLPQVVQTLHALAKASQSSISSLIAHALTTVSSSAGPAFSPYVKNTLSITQAMILNENIYSTPGLLPSIGRLGNAMVACLGPDYVLGSEAYDICRSIVSELRAPDASGVRLNEDILSGALESVLYVQMLVLFVPRALTTGQHVSVLVGTLPSRQPALRRAAADTLRHIAEKETDQVLEQHVEGSLIAALDGETDSLTSEQLKATIEVLLCTGAGSHPKRWIELLGSVATASASISSESGSDLLLGSDSEESSPQQDLQKRDRSVPLQPRLRTKIFAANCLNRIPALAIERNQMHADAILAAKTPGEWLASSAGFLVDIGFKMASGDVDVLRSRGVTLLLETLNVLGSSRDPLSPGELLMFQYQAQYVSALRASLSKGASPAVNAAGCLLVASFLEKGIAASDNSLMEKLLALLCEPLSRWSSGSPDPTQNAYSEWVAAGARAALLESHALCATLSSDSCTEHSSAYGEIVTRAHGPFYTILVECWTGLLEDSLVLLTESEEVQQKHILRLYGRLGASKAPTLAAAKYGIEKTVKFAWPTILDAATLVMTRDRTVSHGDSGKSRYQSLFHLTACFSHRMSDFTSIMTVLKALKRLTMERYAKEGWLNDQMMNVAAYIALETIQSSMSLKNGTAETWEVGAEVIKNVMECTALKHRPGDIESRTSFALDCVTAVASHSTSLEISLATLRITLSKMMSLSAPLEEISYILYHSIKSAYDLCLSSGSERVACTCYLHIIETAKIVSLRNNNMNIASAMDPSVPSIEHILSFATAEGCQSLQNSLAGSQGSVEPLVKLLLVLGSTATLSIDSNTDSSGNNIPLSNSQKKCLNCISACFEHSEPIVQAKAFRAAEEWIHDDPNPLWAMHCGAVIYPPAIEHLYEYSISMTEEDQDEWIQLLIHICTALCELGGEFGESCMHSFLPVLIKMASNESNTAINAKSINSLLTLAKGKVAPTFKSMIPGVPEEERVKLHKALASGSAHRSQRTDTSTTNAPIKGIQALDLSRFT